MTKTTLIVAGFALLSLVTLQAQDAPAPAWRGVVQEQKPLKDAIVIGAQLTEGPAGQSWDFQVLDTNYKTDRRIVQWSGGKISADRSGRLKAFDRGNLIPLGSTNLTLSVAAVRTKTHQLLTDAGRKAQTIEYALSRKEGQEQPQWAVTCLKEDGSRLAVMSFNADKSQLLEVDLEPGNPKLKAAEKGAKSFGKDVERTFKGVGADLEEFFTGKRTVDK